MMKLPKWIYALLFHLPLACFTDCTSNNDHSQPATSDSAVAQPISFADEKYPPNIPLSEQLQSMIDELETSSLTGKKTVNEIPTFIRTFLDSLTGGFSMANPGEEFQQGCIADYIIVQEKAIDPKTGDSITIETTIPPPPSRQLIFFGMTNKIALMSYYSGGFATCTHIMIIRFNNSEVTDYWHGYGEGDLTNKQEIVSYLKVETALHRRIDASLMEM